MFRYGWVQRVCVCSLQVLMGNLIFMDCAPQKLWEVPAHGAPPFLRHCNDRVLLASLTH